MVYLKASLAVAATCRGVLAIDTGQGDLGFAAKDRAGSVESNCPEGFANMRHVSHVITERKQVTRNGWMYFTFAMTVKIQYRRSEILNGTFSYGAKFQGIL